jgi:hypothetical protein
MYVIGDQRKYDLPNLPNLPDLNASITILDIINRLVFYLKHVSETRFCLF